MQAVTLARLEAPPGPLESLERTTSATTLGGTDRLLGSPRALLSANESRKSNAYTTRAPDMTSAGDAVDIGSSRFQFVVRMHVSCIGGDNARFVGNQSQNPR